MKEQGMKMLKAGAVLLALFVSWTMLVQTVDVQPIGPQGTEVGFAAINGWFHAATGTNMILYHITDWLGLVPVFVCLLFAGLGLRQLIKRKSLLGVDGDILLLGGYYAAVIAGYLLFEMFPVNYRPVLIDGFLEASYPSSTTLLVLGVMPTLNFQAVRRLDAAKGRKVICMLTIAFSAFMVVGRVISGVHWVTDIVGSVLLSRGLFLMYKALVCLMAERQY